MPNASGKHKIIFPAGYAKDSSGKGVTSIIAPKGDSCCFVDCCCGAIWLKDRVTGKYTAMALEDGVFVAYAEEDFVCNNGKIPAEGSKEKAVELKIAKTTTKKKKTTKNKK